MSKVACSILMIIGVLLLVGVGVYIARQLAGDGSDLKQVKEVARFIEPDAYYTSTQVKRWKGTPQGQGKVLFPEVGDVGEFAITPKPFLRQDGFIGPEGCRECHTETVDSFLETAHFRTSTLPTAESVKGRFSGGENELQTSAAELRYAISKTASGYCQEAIVQQGDREFRHAQGVDIVTGSGNHGQTHLYWQGNRLYQLPVTWFTTGGGKWVNSPGYRDGFADFARPILPGCMSCHATRLDVRPNTANEFDPDTMILGVTCERCHGPGEQHANFHRENPEATETKFIVHPGDLPRERMNDVCGQCHNGDSQPLKPSFSFRPGDTLSEFKKFPDADKAGFGVHSSNQHARMVKSRCYLEDDTMDCRSCHNPHQHEHGDVKLFSNRCQKCHEMADCGQFPITGNRIADNCIDCHMPKQFDNEAAMTAGAEQIFPEIRDHNIRIHPEATKRVLELWKTTDMTD